MRQGRHKAMYVSGNAQLGYVEIVVTRVVDGFVAEEFEYAAYDKRTSALGEKSIETVEEVYEYLKKFFPSMEEQKAEVLKELEDLEVEIEN